jgi:hypothetical protein|tara:strand:- start:318 stop:620 length:303 start_codon:yes stop_codon:yes gene_type:complete
MTIAKISWSFDAPTEMLTILKIDGMAFKQTGTVDQSNKIVELKNDHKAFHAHLMKYRPGTTITLDEFCNNPDYNGVLYTIVDMNGIEGVELKNTSLAINL